VLLLHIAATADRSRRTTAMAAVAVLTAQISGWRITNGGWAHGVTEAVVPIASVALVSWTLGSSIRQRREYAERLREQAAAQAVQAERLRIARELHDTVAHSIGVVAIQAGAAKRVIETQPEGARKALDAIELTSRETLVGLRQMLGTLHRTEPEPVTGMAGVDRADAGHRHGRTPRKGALAGHETSVATRHGPIGIPHHPGVIDQRGPPCERPPLPGERRLPHRRAGHRGRRRRDRRAARRRDRRHRLRNHWNARPSRPAGRRVQRRATPRRRLPGDSQAAGMTVRIVLADDQPLVRAGLRMVIADAPDLEIVGEAGTGTEAVRISQGTPARRRRDGHPDARHGRHRGHPDDHRQRPSAARTHAHHLRRDNNVYAALRAGASGFLVKDMALDDILTATRVQWPPATPSSRRASPAA